MKYNDYKPETKSLLNALTKAGFTLLEGNNGDENFPATKPDFLEELTAADEARLWVKTPEGKRKGLYLVFGNSPGELVCDYHVDPALEAVIDAESAKWDGKPIPTEEK